MGAILGEGRLPVEVARMVMPDGKVRYGITFSMTHSKGVTHAETWAEEAVPAGLPQLGAAVMMPVDVRVFATRSGPRYSISVAGAQQGESF